MAQEYTGQARHLVNLVPQWAHYLKFDTMARGPGTTLADVLAGTPLRSGMAAVSNLGSDPTWTGHPLSAVNTYGFGRLAWDPRLDAASVTREWLVATFSPVPAPRLEPLQAALMASWEVYENYTSPLGVGFVCAANHYDMDLPHRQPQTNATATHVGYQRNGTYGRDYRNPQYVQLATCPEAELLCFHNVPYTHRLRTRGNASVIEYIYASHAAGARAAAGYVQTWLDLAPELGRFPEYNVTLDRLRTGAADAAKFRDAVVDYFAKLTGIPPPPP